MNYQWSNYQLNVFDAVKNSDRNLMIEAVAGSGKSTVLEEANRIFDRRVSIVNAAFNTHIKEALRKKLPTYREVGTLNALGWGIYRENVDPVKLDVNKNFSRLQKMIKDEKVFWRVQRVVCRLVSLFKQLNLSCFPENWLQLCDTYGIEFENDEIEIEEWGSKLYAWSIDELDIADFDDQIFQVLRQGWPVKKRDVAMIDESQDQSPLQITFSMLLGKRIINCGDRFQAIYVFRGADVNAIPRIIEETDALCLPLSICYRCPKAVVEKAQYYVPQIKWAPGAIEGKVEDIKILDFWKRVEDGDYVTCRTTAPLVSKCLEAIRKNVKAFVRGRDIGQNIMELVDKVRKNNDLDVFLMALNDYRDERVSRLSKSNRQVEITLLDDKVETINALSEQCETVDDFEPLVETIFSDRNKEGIEFSTIHKAKGREKKNVYRLRVDLCPHSKCPEHLMRIEYNLKYVEITRSQEYLGTIIEPTGRRY